MPSQAGLYTSAIQAPFIVQTFGFQIKKSGIFLHEYFRVMIVLNFNKRRRRIDVFFQNIDVWHVLSCLVIPSLVEWLTKQTSEKVYERIVVFLAEDLPTEIRRIVGKYF
jgi:hypothetical protein